MPFTQLSKDFKIKSWKYKSSFLVCPSVYFSKQEKTWKGKRDIEKQVILPISCHRSDFYNKNMQRICLARLRSSVRRWSVVASEQVGIQGWIWRSAITCWILLTIVPHYAVIYFNLALLKWIKGWCSLVNWQFSSHAFSDHCSEGNEFFTTKSASVSFKRSLAHGTNFARIFSHLLHLPKQVIHHVLHWSVNRWTTRIPRLRDTCT